MCETHLRHIISSSVLRSDYFVYRCERPRVNDYRLIIASERCDNYSFTEKNAICA